MGSGVGLGDRHFVDTRNEVRGCGVGEGGTRGRGVCGAGLASVCVCGADGYHSSQREGGRYGVAGRWDGFNSPTHLQNGPH